MLDVLDAKALISLYKTSITSNTNNSHTRGNIFMKKHDLITDKWSGFARRNPLLLLKYLDWSEENYYSVNSIQGHSLSDDQARNVVGYNGLFADLDISGHQGKTDLTKIHQVFVNIKHLAHSHQILPYTYCVYTGHGLDLVWLFKCQLTDNSKQHKMRLVWESLEDSLLSQLEKVPNVGKYVDSRVHDPSRVIRFPGTNNVKYILADSMDTEPLSTKVLDFAGNKYDFWTLYNKFVRKPWVVHQSRKYEQSTDARFAVAMDYKSINLKHRLMNVEELINLRNGNMHGYRNSTLHIIASGLLYINHFARKYDKKVQNEIKEAICDKIAFLNQDFKEPLPTKEINSLKAKVKASQFNVSSKSNDFAKYYYKKLSKSKRGGIINFLHVTPKEQWYLAYLRTPEVQRKHRNWVRKVNRKQKRLLVKKSHEEVYKQAIIRKIHYVKRVIWYYKHSGKNQKAVAEHFGHKSASWLSNLINKYGHIHFSHSYSKNTNNNQEPCNLDSSDEVNRLTG